LPSDLNMRHYHRSYFKLYDRRMQSKRLRNITYVKRLWKGIF